MTATPTHAEIIAACDVLMRSRHYPNIAGLPDAKADAEEDLAEEQAAAGQRNALRCLGHAMCNELPEPVRRGINHETLGQMVQNAVEATGARIVTGDEQPVGELAGYMRITESSTPNHWASDTLRGLRLPRTLSNAHQVFACDPGERIAAVYLLPEGGAR